MPDPGKKYKDKETGQVLSDSEIKAGGASDEQIQEMIAQGYIIPTDDVEKKKTGGDESGDLSAASNASEEILPSTGASASAGRNIRDITGDNNLADLTALPAGQMEANTALPPRKTATELAAEMGRPVSESTSSGQRLLDKSQQKYIAAVEQDKLDRPRITEFKNSVKSIMNAPENKGKYLAVKRPQLVEGNQPDSKFTFLNPSSLDELLASVNTAAGQPISDKDRQQVREQIMAEVEADRNSFDILQKAMESYKLSGGTAEIGKLDLKAGINQGLRNDSESTRVPGMTPVIEQQDPSVAVSTTPDVPLTNELGQPTDPITLMAQNRSKAESEFAEKKNNNFVAYTNKVSELRDQVTAGKITQAQADSEARSMRMALQGTIDDQVEEKVRQLNAKTLPHIFSEKIAELNAKIQEDPTNDVKNDPLRYEIGQLQARIDAGETYDLREDPRWKKAITTAVKEQMIENNEKLKTVFDNSYYSQKTKRNEALPADAMFRDQRVLVNKLATGLFTGVGQMSEMAGGVMNMYGNYTVGNYLTDSGKELLQNNALPAQIDEKGNAVVVDSSPGDWVARNVFAQIPLMATLIATSEITGGTSATLLTRVAGVKNMAKAVEGAIGGLAATFPEAVLEAGDYYNSAIKSGKTPDEARRGAEKVLSDNLLILGVSNPIEFGMMKLPTKGLLGKVGVGTFESQVNGVQEVVQNWAQEKQTNPGVRIMEYAVSPEGTSSYLAGAGVGVAQSAAVGQFTQWQNQRATDRMFSFATKDRTDENGALPGNHVIAKTVFNAFRMKDTEGRAEELKSVVKKMHDSGAYTDDDAQLVSNIIEDVKAVKNLIPEYASEEQSVAIFNELLQVRENNKKREKSGVESIKQLFEKANNESDKRIQRIMTGEEPLYFINGFETTKDQLLESLQDKSLVKSAGKTIRIVNDADTQTAVDEIVKPKKKDKIQDTAQIDQVIINNNKDESPKSEGTDAGTEISNDGGVPIKGADAPGVQVARTSILESLRNDPKFANSRNPQIFGLQSVIGTKDEGLIFDELRQQASNADVFKETFGERMYDLVSSLGIDTPGRTMEEMEADIEGQQAREEDDLTGIRMTKKLAALDKEAEEKKRGPVVSFETAKGSVYTYGEGGKVSRFKTATSEQNEPQDVTAFVKFKNPQHEQDFLEALHQDGEQYSVKLIDRQGNVITSNEQAQGKELNLAVVDRNTREVVNQAAATTTPTEGFNTYDERKIEEDLREKHIGNKVTKINYSPKTNTDAVQEQSTTADDVRDQPEAGQEVSERNAQRQETSREGAQENINDGITSAPIENEVTDNSSTQNSENEKDNTSPGRGLRMRGITERNEGAPAVGENITTLQDSQPAPSSPVEYPVFAEAVYTELDEADIDSAYDYNLDLPSMRTAERKKAAKDLRAGKNSVVARRLQDFLVQWYMEGNVPFIRGRGDNVERFGLAINDYVALSNAEVQLPDNAADAITDNILSIINNEGITLENIDSLAEMFGGFPFTQEDFNNVKNYLQQSPSAGQIEEISQPEPQTENAAGTVADQQTPGTQPAEETVGDQVYAAMAVETEIPIANEATSEGRLSNLRGEVANRQQRIGEINVRMNELRGSPSTVEVRNEIASLAREKETLNQDIDLAVAKINQEKVMQSRAPQATPASFAEKGRNIANKLRSLKLNKGDILQSNLFGIPIAIWDGAVELAATAIENGAKLADAIQQAVNYVKANHQGDFDEEGFRSALSQMDDDAAAPDDAAEQAFEVDLNIKSRTQEARQKIGKAWNRWFKVGGGIAKSIRDLKDQEVGNINQWTIRIRYVQRDFLAAMKQAYGKEFAAKSQLVNNALTGDPDALTTVETEAPEVAEQVKIMRSLIDGLTNQLIEQGILNNVDVARADYEDAKANGASESVVERLKTKLDFAEQIQNNVGTYINRQYEKFYNKDFKRKIAEQQDTLNAAAAYIYKHYTTKDENGVRRKLTKEEIELEILRIVELEEVDDFRTGSNLAMDTSILKERHDIPVEIRNLMGEIKDAEWNFVNTTMKMATLLERSKFLKEMWESGRGEFFFEASNPTKGAITKIDNKQWGELNGKYTTPELAEQLKRWGQAIGDESNALTALRQATSYAKAAKTSLSWVSELRNLIGNGSLLLVNGNFSPSELKNGFLGIKELFGKVNSEDARKLVERYVQLGLINGSIKAAELKGVTDSMIEIMPTGEKWDTSTMKSIVRKARGLKNKLGEVYGATDDIFKIVTFESERKKLQAAYEKSNVKKTDEELDKEAAEIAKMIMPTFSKLPDFIRGLALNVPFLGSFPSYPTELLRTTVNTIQLGIQQSKSDNPEIRKIGNKRLGWFMGTAVIFPGISAGLAMGLAALGYGASDDEKEALLAMLPDYYKNQNINVVKKGNIYYVHLMSGMDGHAWLREILNAGLRGDDPLHGGLSAVKEFLSPVVDEGMVAAKVGQWYSNKDNYGKPLYNNEDNLTNKSAAFAKHFGDAFTPTTATDIFKPIKAGIAGEEGKRNIGILKLVSGQSVLMINPEDALYFKMKDFEKRISEARRLKDPVQEKEVIAAIQEEEKKYFQKVAPLFDYTYNNAKAMQKRRDKEYRANVKRKNNEALRSNNQGK